MAAKLHRTGHPRAAAGFRPSGRLGVAAKLQRTGHPRVVAAGFQVAVELRATGRPWRAAGPLVTPGVRLRVALGVRGAVGLWATDLDLGGGRRTALGVLVTARRRMTAGLQPTGRRRPRRAEAVPPLG